MENDVTTVTTITEEVTPVTEDPGGPEKKHRFHFPHAFVLIFAISVVAAILANVVPAGQYERVFDEASGRTIVVADSFEYVDRVGCSLFDFFLAFPEGFVDAAQIMFFIMFAYFFVRTLLQNGTFDALVGWTLRKVGGNIKLIIPFCMMLFGILGSTIGLYEETYGMIPIFMSIAIALGFDGIVGSSIVYVAVAVGFASATINPFTIQVAQRIAGLQPTSGMSYRIVCFVVFMCTAIIYVYRYATKVQKDPTKSVIYGEKNNFADMVGSQEELLNAKFTTSQKLSCVIFVGTIVAILVGVMRYGWYINEIAALFIMMGLLVAIISRFSGTQIAENLVSAAREMQYGILIVGLSRAIEVIMDNACITDTIVHALASWLQNFAGMFTAVGMLFVQNIINFFIPSGAGQAIVTMPILTPLSDLVGVSRQVAVLAYQFGDGFSNIFWPTSVFMMCGIMQVPINKWYKYITPLFLVIFVEQIVLLLIACMIGYS